MSRNDNNDIKQKRKKYFELTYKHLNNKNINNFIGDYSKYVDNIKNHKSSTKYVNVCNMRKKIY